MESRILFVGLEIDHVDIMRRIRLERMLDKLRIESLMLMAAQEDIQLPDSWVAPEPIMLYNFNLETLPDPVVHLEPLRLRKGKSKKYQPSALDRLNQSKSANNITRMQNEYSNIRRFTR